MRFLFFGEDDVDTSDDADTYYFTVIKAKCWGIVSALKRGTLLQMDPDFIHLRIHPR